MYKKKSLLFKLLLVVQFALYAGLKENKDYALVPQPIAKKLDVINSFLGRSLLQESHLNHIDLLFGIQRSNHPPFKIISIGGDNVEEVCITKASNIPHLAPKPLQHPTTSAMSTVQQKETVQYQPGAVTSQVPSQDCFIAVKGLRVRLMIDIGTTKVEAKNIIVAADILKKVIKGMTSPSFAISAVGLPFASAWMFPGKFMAPFLLKHSYYFLTKGYRSGFNIKSLIITGLYKKYIMRLIPWPLSSVWLQLALFNIYQIKFGDSFSLFKWLR